MLYAGWSKTIIYSKQLQKEELIWVLADQIILDSVKFDLSQNNLYGSCTFLFRTNLKNLHSHWVFFNRPALYSFQFDLNKSSIWGNIILFYWEYEKEASAILLSVLLDTLSCFHSLWPHQIFKIKTPSLVCAS